MPEYDITTDGITVWVNGPYSLLGRFGKMGVDIHHAHEPGLWPMPASECLFCTHAQTTRQDWGLFVEKMLQLHGVKVPDKYLPDRFRTKEN